MARKSLNEQKERLFEEKLVPAKPGSDKLFDVSYGAEESKPVKCLGMTFPNDMARRKYFIEKLREKLKDPAFRKIEGFPVGEDEDILALSDPPYYTACPNPFLREFVLCNGSSFDPHSDNYHRDPFAFDVSEGKNDPIYNAHMYHTKVPHKAIMRYILHYTNPGDIILDFFCGTGMTGVAAQECSRINSPEYVDLEQRASTRSGHRHAVLIDLSPIATYIAQSYVKQADLNAFRSRAEEAIDQSIAAYGWMFETQHVGWPMLVGGAKKWANASKVHSPTPGNVNFFVWSERFVCQSCSKTFRLSDVTDFSLGTTPKDFPCPLCGTETNKRSLSREMEVVFDPLTKRTFKRVKRDLVLINYTHGDRRYEKFPDKRDLSLLSRISDMPLSTEIPTDALPHGERRLKDCYDGIGITHVHDFYFHRTLHVLGDLAKRLNLREPDHQSLLSILFTSQLINISVMNRFRRVSFPYNPMSGTFYVGSLVSEANPFPAYTNKISKFVKAKEGRAGLSSIVSVQSATDLEQLGQNSIDYIFIDPPFGRNLHYSELNFVWESWLRVKTDRTPEAVMDRGRNRELFEYQELMRRCFKEGCRVLKPGRWMTVEFHNSSNAVWNAIQEALLSARMMVADVRTLDKQAETYKQSQQGLVKADLIISAYKPPIELEEKFQIEATTEQGAWTFIRSHLGQLPVFLSIDGRVEVIAERQAYLLYDRMVAFHVQRGFTVPLSSSEFRAGLVQQFPERDGMYFLSGQAMEYDRKRLDSPGVQQYDLFVNDEKSAIQWVHRQLSKQPTSYKELQPLYMKEAQRVWEEHEQPLELLEILNQNFHQEEDGRWHVPDSKNEAHLEQMRHKALLKEFQSYFDTKGKLKIVRTEALRAGFKESWQKKDYLTIIQMGKRVPEAVIQEDAALLMYFDNASLMLGE